MSLAAASTPRPHDAVWPKRLPRELAVPVTSIPYNLEVSARRFPNKAAYVFFGKALSYAELYRQAQAVAGDIGGARASADLALEGRLRDGLQRVVGEPQLDVLVFEQLHVLTRDRVAGLRQDLDERRLVQLVQRAGAGRAYLGRIQSGEVRAGDEIVVLPSGRRVTVAEVRGFEGELEAAQIFHGHGFSHDLVAEAVGESVPSALAARATSSPRAT